MKGGGASRPELRAGFIFLVLVIAALISDLIARLLP
jgi:hypothetical protein